MEHGDKRTADITGAFTIDQREVLDLLPDGVLLTDVAGNIYDANHAFCAMLKTDRCQLIGLHVSALVDPDDLKLRPPRIEEFLRCGVIRAHRLLRRQDGTDFWVDFHARRINEKFTITVFREILEEAPERLDSVA
jgi:PAS domain S-box-containing protein